MSKLCRVSYAKFDFHARIFHLRVVCEKGEEFEIDLSYEDAEKLKHALDDMAIGMYVYKTGGFVDDY